MSTDKWAYDPERCNGAICCGDCDRCTRWQHDEWLELSELQERQAIIKERSKEE